MQKHGNWFRNTSLHPTHLITQVVPAAPNALGKQVDTRQMPCRFSSPEEKEQVTAQISEMRQRKFTGQPVPVGALVDLHEFSAEEIAALDFKPFVKDFHEWTTEEPYGLLGHTYIARLGGVLGDEVPDRNVVHFAPGETVNVFMKEVFGKTPDLEPNVEMVKELALRGLVAFPAAHPVYNDAGQMAITIANLSGETITVELDTPFFYVRVMQLTM